MLLRQAEFTIYYRRKKCRRRVFLFEEVIIFSKTSRSSTGNDNYVYKTSIKVCCGAGFSLKLRLYIALWFMFNVVAEGIISNSYRLCIIIIYYYF